MRSATRSEEGRPIVSTIRPSARKTTASADAAAFGSWVTITTVWLETVDCLSQEREDLLAGLGVERSCRLVGEDDLGPGDQGAGDRDALLLAAREFSRSVLDACRKADAPGNLDQPVLGDRPFGESKRERDVLLDGQGRDEVERLENEADALAAQPAQRVFVEAREIHLGQMHVPDRGPVEAGGTVEEGALAGAGRPHHGRVRALCQSQRQFTQGGNGVVSTSVRLGDSRHANAVGHHHLRLSDLLQLVLDNPRLHDSPFPAACTDTNFAVTGAGRKAGDWPLHGRFSGVRAGRSRVRSAGTSRPRALDATRSRSKAGRVCRRCWRRTSRRRAG